MTRSVASGWRLDYEAHFLSVSPYRSALRRWLSYPNFSRGRPPATSRGLGGRHVNVGTGVFVLQNESTLVAMQAASFASEDDFQRLLAAFPELLAGD